MTFMTIRLLPFLLLLSLCAESAFGQSLIQNPAMNQVLIQNPATGYYLSAQPGLASSVPKYCFNANNAPVGYPGTNNTVRLYSRLDCTSLKGIGYPNGLCLRPGGGSFSVDCRVLNTYSYPVSMVPSCNNTQLCYWTFTPQNQLILFNSSLALTWTGLLPSPQNLNLMPLRTDSSPAQIFTYDAASMAIISGDNDAVTILGADKPLNASYFSSPPPANQQFRIVNVLVPLMLKYTYSILCPPTSVGQPPIVQPYTANVNSCLWQRILLVSGAYQYVLPQLGWALSYDPTVTNNQITVKPYNSSVDISQTFTNSNISEIISSLDGSSKFNTTLTLSGNAIIVAAFYKSLYSDAGYSITNNAGSTVLLCNSGAALAGAYSDQVFCYSVSADLIPLSSLTSVPRISTWTCPGNAIINGLELGSINSTVISNTTWLINGSQVVGVLCATPGSSTGYVVSSAVQFVPKNDGKLTWDPSNSVYGRLGSSGACAPGFVYQKLRENQSDLPICVQIVTQTIVNSKFITFPWSMDGHWFVIDSDQAQYKFDGDFSCQGFLTKYELKDWPWNTMSSWVGRSDLNPLSKQQFMTCQVLSNVNISGISTTFIYDQVNNSNDGNLILLGVTGLAGCAQGTAISSMGASLSLTPRLETTFQELSIFDHNHSLRYCPLRRVILGMRPLQCAPFIANNVTTVTSSTNDGTFDCGNGYLSSVYLTLQENSATITKSKLGTLRYSCVVPT